ncbi:hypothetical protein V1512DRAFT_268410 [Lipomyces arxii]|uniref:uncharacterized protein n=1 Tax=Lipomyces arxii TaxID=56418 RepID=UPI0034CEB681
MSTEYSTHRIEQSTTSSNKYAKRQQGPVVFKASVEPDNTVTNLIDEFDDLTDDDLELRDEIDDILESQSPVPVAQTQATEKKETNDPDKRDYNDEKPDVVATPAKIDTSTSLDSNSTNSVNTSLSTVDLGNTTVMNTDCDANETHSSAVDTEPASTKAEPAQDAPPAFVQDAESYIDHTRKKHEPAGVNPLGPYPYSHDVPVTTPIESDNLYSDLRDAGQSVSALERHYSEMTFEQWQQAGDELVVRAAQLVKRIIDVRKQKATALNALEQTIDSRAGALDRQFSDLLNEQDKIRSRASELFAQSGGAQSQR